MQNNAVKVQVRHIHTRPIDTLHSLEFVDISIHVCHTDIFPGCRANHWWIFVSLKREGSFPGVWIVLIVCRTKGEPRTSRGSDTSED